MDKKISLALAFSAILHEWLTPEQMQEVLRLNKTPEYSDGSCATHNYCDPNQAMIDAEQAVIGEGFDTLTAEHFNLINETWDFARKHDFFTAIYQPNYAAATGDTLTALAAASSFMGGFTDDDTQEEPIDGDLELIDAEIARLEGKGLTVKPDPFVGIIVEGGIVQNCLSNVNGLKVAVVDWDKHSEDRVLVSSSEADYTERLSALYEHPRSTPEYHLDKKDRKRVCKELKEYGF